MEDTKQAGVQLDLDKLLQLAEAATPGPWKQAGVLAQSEDGDTLATTKHPGMLRSMPVAAAKKNAAYIAAASPDVVAELVRRLKDRSQDVAKQAEHIDQLERQLALKLEPLKAADVIMVRADLKPDDMVRIRYALRELLPQAKQMVLVPGGMELACLDDAAMRAAGWVRAEADQRTIVRYILDAAGFPVSCELSDGTTCDTTDGITWTPRTAQEADHG